MKTLLIFLIALTLSSVTEYFAQYSVEKEIVEPSMVTLTTPQQPGGRYITSIAENGKYVKVLIVYVQFKDDNWDTTWSEWPKNSAPTGWMNTGIIDQTVNQNSTNQNLTHYYTVMSKGHYKVIGNTYHKITTNTRAEYISMGYQRGQINKQILQELDASISFSTYDNWNKIGEFNHAWGTDGEVDMIWMVYRNIDNDLLNPGYTAWQMGFGQRDLDNGQWVYSRWSGEASLGWAGILSVDGGQRTIDLGSYGLVSGITMMEGYHGLGHVKNVIIHEFALKS